MVISRVEDALSQQDKRIVDLQLRVKPRVKRDG
jgi:hypothetical protein